jgi:hypothetical protein
MQKLVGILRNIGNIEMNTTWYYLIILNILQYYMQKVQYSIKYWVILNAANITNITYLTHQMVGLPQSEVGERWL